MRKITKVLIVDDEPQNVLVMREILSFHPQYICKGAVSGEEALAIVNTFYPDIILLDVMMPGIDGYQVCKRIRTGNQHKFAKIIMVSGMSMIDYRLRGYDAGADDYLTKPYDEDELLAKLEVYSKLSRMEEVDTLKTTALNILRHETRTPLNGILLGSELLGHMDGLSKKALDYIELVRQSGLKIQELVEKITRYFSIKDGMVKNLSEQYLCLVISSIISRLHVSAGSEVEVNCGCDKDIKFTADWELLQEAFYYVIDNAFKVSRETGVVTIHCWQKAADIIIQVSDQGPGVHPSLTERVFDGLFTPDLLHHRQGTGLGLAIAKEIIEEHGGRISCRNQEHCGTLLEIILNDQKR
jgi:signal transduction histidine kinase